MGNSDEDILKTINLKEDYITGKYDHNKKPCIQNSSICKSNISSKRKTFAEAVKSFGKRKIEDNVSGPSKKQSCELSLEDLKKIKPNDRTEEQRKRMVKLRQEACRARQTEEKKNSVRLQDREIKRKLRLNQTQTEKDIIHEKQNESMRTLRLNQTEKEKEIICQKIKESMRSLRSNQTKTQKDNICEQKRESMRTLRLNQTEKE